MAQQDYWRGGWANIDPNTLPGARGAQVSRGNYGPINALADILGAYWMKKEKDKQAKRMAEGYGKLMEPVNVNTGEVVSTPQFDMGAIQSAGAGGYGNNPQDVSLMPQSGFGSEGYQIPLPAQQVPSPQVQSEMPVPQLTPAAPQIQPMVQDNSYQAEYQKQMQEHPEWFDLDGNYMGNTYNVLGEVSDSNLDPLTARKFNLLSRDFKDKWGEPLSATSMRRHGDGSSWHDSGQAFDVAGGVLESNPEARAWAVNQAAKYGLVPLDEYAHPSAHATGGHLHFSDHGDALANNYEQPSDGGAAAQGYNQQDSQPLGAGIQVPQTQYYAPPERQLHQATKEQPWTDTLNSKERIKAAYDSAWAAKMKDIVANYPELLQDRDAMNNIMAMREKGLQSLLGDWQETQFKSGLENFQRNLASGNINKAMYEGYRDGLDPNTMKVLASPEWDSSLVNFGGVQRIVSKNNRTGEFLVNGHQPTQADLKEVMTEAQSAQIGLQRDRLAHDIEEDNIKQSNWQNEFAANNAYRMRSLDLQEEAIGKRKDYNNPSSSNTQDTKELKQRLSGLRTRITMLKQLHPYWKAELAAYDENDSGVEPWVKELVDATNEAIRLSDQLGINYTE